MPPDPPRLSCLQQLPVQFYAHHNYAFEPYHFYICSDATWAQIYAR